MISYHGEVKNKRAILKQLRAHRDADEIAKGFYWEGGKGCAVGCTIHGNNHAEYETRFGIPQALARLEDRIFEGLPNMRAKNWPIEFMSAVPVDVDLSRVHWAFLAWLLTDDGVNPGITHPLVRDAVKQCADLMIALSKGEPLNKSAAWSAWSAAWSAWSAAESAESARSAAWSAAEAAESARSAASAASAASAGSAAWSAWSAARSAESARSAARSAAWSAAEAAASAAASAAESAAESAESAAESARSAAYVKMADKLLTLLRAA